MRIVDVVATAALLLLVVLVAVLLRVPPGRPEPLPPVLGARLVGAAAATNALLAAAGVAALDRSALLVAGLAALAATAATALSMLAMHRLGGRSAAGVALAVCGLLVVGALSQVRLLDGHATTAIAYAAMTVLVMVVVAVLGPRLPLGLSAAALGWGGVALLLLPLVPVLGRRINGAWAWINLGGLTFQPAEIARPVLVVSVALALFEAAPALRDGRIRAVLPGLLPLGVSVALLGVLHRDLGPALVLTLSALVLTLMMRPPVLTQLYVLVLGVASAGVALAAEPRLRERLRDWLEPVRANGDPENTGAALQAMARGGVWGSGLDRGRPDAVVNAHNDFILSAVTEERGLVGAACVVALLAALSLHLLRLPGMRTDDAGRVGLLALAILISVHSLYVVLASLGLLPLTGMVVPFVSQGGSALLAAGAVVGAVVGGTASRRGAARRPPRRPLRGHQPARRAFAGAWAFTLVALAVVVLASPVPPRLLSAQRGIEAQGRLVAGDGVLLAATVTDLAGTHRAYPEGDLVGSVVGELTPGGDGWGLDRTTAASARCQPDFVETLLDVPCPAVDVVLTLDTATQAAAEQALAGQTGEVVVIDVPTFTVLADYSTPRGTEGEGSPSTERTSVPGSVFKVVVAAAAVQRGVPTATPTRTGYTPDGGIGTVPNYGGGACGGALSEAIAVSCNTAFAEIATRVGAAAIEETAGRFGFGSAALTEDVPLVASEVGNGLDDADALARTGIGQQDVRATPMQVAVVAATIAADGERTPVRHVAGRCTAAGFEAAPTTEPAQVVSPSTAAAIATGMREAVTSGTAGGLKVASVPVAAKTGTAQTGTGPDDAWVMAFAPVDEPRVAIAVRVAGIPDDEVSGGRQAVRVALPVIESALSATAVADHPRYESICG